MCERCGLIYADPLPFDVKEYYSEDYRLDYKGAYIPKPKHVLRAGLVALDRLGRLGHGVLPQSGSLLDVGSGGGEFVYLCRSLGLAARGIEPNRGYATYSMRELGLEVELARSDAELPAGTMDVVTMWHVLEHIDDPSSALANMGRTLKRGGLLVVEVPNIRAVCQAPGSTFHAAHIFSFSPRTLEALAIGAGLEKVSLALSPDGGNVMLVCRPAAGVDVGPAEPDWAALAADGREIAAMIRNRSFLGYLARGPWLRRAAARQLKAIREMAWLALRGRQGQRGGSLRKGILDTLYASEAKKSRLVVRPIGQPAAD
jgi:2-polyprenyl-3-methyl-5-hydroxy-6-metoxy-1,4-benzoquinol methylase